MPEEKANFIT